MNKILHVTSVLLTLLTIFLSSTCFANTPINLSLHPMLVKVLPSVVNIRAKVKVTDPATLRKLEKNQHEGAGQDEFLSVGSGVIINAAKGYILTNAHVVDNAERIVITLSDKGRYTAKMIGMDKPSDIALLQIQANNLSAITLADSKNLNVGDFVAAIGNPFGLSQSVTSGIISALGRSTLGIENYENFIQIDASINPGNSGGALVNMQGQLIGINTAILSDRGSIGIGFAIPSNMVKSVVQQLIEYGNVRRGTLGVGAQDITPELATAFNLHASQGAVVTQVTLNSPAAKAGLQIGDIITQVNGEEIKKANDVVNEIGFTRVDSKVNITVLRKNKPLTLSATLTDPKKRAEADENANPFLYGVSLKDFTLSSPIHGDIKGIMVIAVQEDTNAWHSDVRPGDIIVSANQQKTSSVTELRKMAATTKDQLLLNIVRGPGAVFLVVKKD